MKIAQIMAGAANGGAELFFERMTFSLAAAGEPILPIIRTHPDRVARLRAAGLSPMESRFGGPLDLLTKPKIRRSLKTFQADLAIAWMSRAASKLPRGNWINIGRLGGYYPLKYFRACDHLIGNTHGIVNWIIGQGIDPTRVHYLPNFVEDFAETEPASRETLGIPESAPLMLGLGRLHAVKGFDTLIRAAALLPESYCIIAGEGPERHALEKLITKLNLTHRVKLLGWRTDSGALLKAADIFVSSSRHEPLGNMVLEAFSAQTPVLATKAEGPAEIIRNNTDGLLIPIDNPAALAAAASSLLTNIHLRIKLALKARQRFSEEFAVQPVTAKWLQTLQTIQAAGRRPAPAGF
jgi:glycosyltransferase involved in cell wall biosynthesis